MYYDVNTDQSVSCQAIECVNLSVALKVAARHSLTSANILLVGGEEPRLLL